MTTSTFINRFPIGTTNIPIALMSQGDRLSETQEKMQEYIE